MKYLKVGDNVMVREENGKWVDTIYVGCNPTGGYICVVPIDADLWDNACSTDTPEYKEYDDLKKL